MTPAAVAALAVTVAAACGAGTARSSQSTGGDAASSRPLPGRSPAQEGRPCRRPPPRPLRGPASAILLLVTGAFVVFSYWLTLGGLLPTS